MKRISIAALVFSVEYNHADVVTALRKYILVSISLLD